MGSAKIQAKQMMRNRLREVRGSLSEVERVDCSRRIAAAFKQGFKSQWRNLALYAAINGEVDTREIFDFCRERGLRVYLPRCETTSRRLEFVEVDRWEDLSPGAYGVLEPNGKAANIDSLEVVLMPGVGFDYGGGRLGYGAGYYDSTFEGWQGVRIGLAYEVQVVEALPMMAHDQRVDCLITEMGHRWVEMSQGEVS